MRTQEFEKLARFQDVSGRDIGCMTIDHSALEKNIYSKRDECAAIAITLFACISNDLIRTGSAALGTAAETSPVSGSGARLALFHPSRRLTEDDWASRSSAIRALVPTPIGGSRGAGNVPFGIQEFSSRSHFCYRHTDGTKKLIASRGLPTGNRNLNQRVH